MDSGLQLILIEVYGPGDGERMGLAPSVTKLSLSMDIKCPTRCPLMLRKVSYGSIDRQFFGITGFWEGSVTCYFSRDSRPRAGGQQRPFRR